MSTPSRMTAEEFLAQREEALPIVTERVSRRYKNPELGDRLAHNALTDAWLVWVGDDTYFTRIDMTGWATCRAYWRAKDEAREVRRFARLADEHPSDDEKSAKTPESYAIATEPDVERYQVWELVHECLAQLPEDERDVIERHVWELMSDQAQGDLIYGDDGRTRQARGLSLFRWRHEIQEKLRELLLSRGYNPDTGLAP